MPHEREQAVRAVWVNDTHSGLNRTSVSRVLEPQTVEDVFTWNVAVQAGQQVVSRGPYRLIRHPSYTGALITFVASCVLLRSWVVATLAASALTAAFLRRIRSEEALLLKTLPGYDTYMSRTGRLLPRLG